MSKRNLVIEEGSVESNSILNRARTYAKKASARSDELLNIDMGLLAGSRQIIANTLHRLKKKRQMQLKMQLVALAIRSAGRYCSGILQQADAPPKPPAPPPPEPLPPAA